MSKLCSLLSYLLGCYALSYTTVVAGEDDMMKLLWRSIVRLAAVREQMKMTMPSKGDLLLKVYGLGSYGTFIHGPTNANTSYNITSTSQQSDNANSAKMQDEIENLKASLVLMQQKLDAIESERAGTSSSPSSHPNST
nr:uncharacterized protein LOC109176665 [Ipomoea batatas]